MTFGCKYTDFFKPLGFRGKLFTHSWPLKCIFTEFWPKAIPGIQCGGWRCMGITVSIIMMKLHSRHWLFSWEPERLWPDDFNNCGWFFYLACRTFFTRTMVLHFAVSPIYSEMYRYIKYLIKVTRENACQCFLVFNCFPTAITEMW